MKRHTHLFLLIVLALIAGGHFTVARASGPWNDHAVAFTFSSDDGDRAANLAWASVFKSHGQTFTIFIPSTWVGVPLTKLNVADLRSLHNQGFEIASHGRTHVRLTDINDVQLLNELVGSCRGLEAALQDPNYHCRTIGYPDHAHNLHVMAVAESLGFTGARDGGTSSAGYPNFSLGKATWSETSLFELPLTVVSAYLVGAGNGYSEAMTRTKVDSLLTLTAPKNMWINIYAHTLDDIDAQHMTWILDELGQKDVWIANFETVADFYRAGHGMIVPSEVKDVPFQGEVHKPGPTLGLASPNPSRYGQSSIPFSLPQSSEVTLRIINLSGRSVKTLVTQEMNAGDHVVAWDGRDFRGQGVPSGLYLYQLEALGVEATRKLFWIE
jgi:hypothetical protein